jgi:hypothetical protein
MRNNKFVTLAIIEHDRIVKIYLKIFYQQTKFNKSIKKRLLEQKIIKILAIFSFNFSGLLKHESH